MAQQEIARNSPTTPESKVDLSISMYLYRNDMKQMRTHLARVGYSLVGVSVLIVIALWSRTCSLGGFHCFDGGAGRAMVVAQIGVISGLICSLFGHGTYRMLFVAISIAELAAAYLELLVH